MNKKFLFAIMAIAAGLVFGSCASEEEQTEEVVEEIDTVAVEPIEEIDTVAVEAVVEEAVATPEPQKVNEVEEKEKVNVKPVVSSQTKKFGQRVNPADQKKMELVKKPSPAQEEQSKTPIKAGGDRLVKKQVPAIKQ